MPIPESEPKNNSEPRRTGRIRRYVGEFVGALFFLAMIGFVFFALVLLPLYLFGEVLVRFFGLPWSDIVGIEAGLVGLLVALRFGLLWRGVHAGKEKMKVGILRCIFGFHKMVIVGEHWDSIGIDYHRVRVSKCAYCSSRSEEISARYW